MKLPRGFPSLGQELAEVVRRVFTSRPGRAVRLGRAIQARRRAAWHRLERARSAAIDADLAVQRCEQRLEELEAKAVRAHRNLVRLNVWRTAP